MKYIFMVLKDKSTALPEPMFYNLHSDDVAKKKAHELRKMFASVEVFRKVSRRTKRTLDVCPVCNGKKYLGNQWMPRPCEACGATGKRK